MKCAAFVALATLALASGCSSPAARRAGSLPDLPQPAMNDALPAIREHIQKTYDEARAKPKDAGANGRFGMVLQTYGQKASAAVCYQRARLLDARSFQWVYYLGTVQAAMGKNAEAAANFREALKLDPKYLPARLKLADALLAAGELGESRQVFQAIAQEQADQALAHYGLGRVASAQGDAAGSVEHYRRACELSPNFGSAHYALAVAYRKLGENDEAQQHFALHDKNKLGGPPEQDPLMAAIRDLNAGAAHHLKRGVDLEGEGRLAEAAAEHEKALEINPQLQQAHVNLITIYGKVGDVEKAEQHYRTLVQINPNLADSHYNFGVMLHGRGKYREAAEAFKKALEISPAYPEAHNNYGYTLEQEGKLDEALQHYRAAVEQKPNYRLAHFHLGRLLLRRGQTAEAIQHFLQTLTPEDESTPGFMYGLAAAYARTGDRENALRYARDARQRAAVLGQQQLVTSIERDLRTLEAAARR